MSEATATGRTTLALDLGQAADYSALAGIQANGQDEKKRTVWAVPLLQRWTLGTSYPEIVRDVAAVCAKLPKPILVVDATGVGRGVVDLFREANLQVAGLVSATITGGHAANRSGPDALTVPKKDLVGSVQAVLQSRRLKIAKGLKEAATLTAELSNFRVKINNVSATESFEAWRERDHDDLVLAVALAVWHGETMLPINNNVYQLRTRPDDPPRTPYPDEIVFPEIRWFAPLSGYQPMPAPHGELIPGCPVFREQAQAAWFVRRIYEAANVEPPDCVIELDDARRQAVDKTANEFLRKNPPRKETLPV